MKTLLLTSKPGTAALHTQTVHRLTEGVANRRVGFGSQPDGATGVDGDVDVADEAICLGEDVDEVVNVVFRILVVVLPLDDEVDVGLFCCESFVNKRKK